MFERFVQFVGTLTSLPIVATLCGAIAAGGFCYRSPRLRLRLLHLLANDIEVLLGEPGVLNEREEELALKRRSRIVKGMKSIQENFSIDDEKRLDEAVFSFLSSTGYSVSLRDVEGKRTALHESAIARLRDQLDRASALHVMRLGPTWVWTESLRVTAWGLRDLALPVASAILRRAAADASTWGVLGLIFAVFAWYFTTSSQASFFAYIGGGATLGAFAGLAATAYYVYGSIAHPFVRDYWGESRAWMSTALVICLLVAMGLLAKGLLPFLTPNRW